MERKTVQNSTDYQKIVNDWINDTNYVDNIIKIDDIIKMFKDFRFGKAETQVIIASMMACGAKFNRG